MQATMNESEKKMKLMATMDESLIEKLLVLYNSIIIYPLYYIVN